MSFRVFVKPHDFQIAFGHQNFEIGRRSSIKELSRSYGATIVEQIIVNEFSGFPLHYKIIVLSDLLLTLYLVIDIFSFSNFKFGIIVVKHLLTLSRCCLGSI
jgi:hypothetical protein